MSIKRAIQEQEEMINEIVGLWDSFKPTEESIIKKAKSKKQGGKIFAAWKSVLNNVDNLYKKRENRPTFTSKEITPGDLELILRESLLQKE